MTKYEIQILILGFVFFLSITDRLREIAIFPGWHSIFGKGWFDQYYTIDTPKWWPMRDGYHFFKWLPIALLYVLLWWLFDFWIACLMYFVWWLGQILGKLFRKAGI